MSDWVLCSTSSLIEASGEPRWAGPPAFELLPSSSLIFRVVVWLSEEEIFGVSPMHSSSRLDEL